MWEQWSLLDNLGHDIISIFWYVPYVGTLSKMIDFAHPHLDAHILTHSHTLFFHICCTHNFWHKNCWWPTLLGRARWRTRLFLSALRLISLEQWIPWCWGVAHKFTIHKIKIRRDWLASAWPYPWTVNNEQWILR